MGEYRDRLRVERILRGNRFLPQIMAIYIKQTKHLIRKTKKIRSSYFLKST